ncbi:alpha/beta hydrolase family protein [Poriferisphaera corsica]|nr:prolyl oligopeptidase family serine peptidase [Poriferisphaera corsica]
MEHHMIPSGDRHLSTSIDFPAEHGQTELRYPVVIITHGLTGQRIGKSYHLVEFARRLNQIGIACVRFDQSGCGESTGDFIDLTIPRMKNDLLAIRNWVRDQAWCDTKRMGYVGISLGALPTIAVDADHTSSGVVLWAPVYNMPRVFQQTAKSGLRAIMDMQGWVPFRGLRIGKGFIDHLNTINPDALISKSSAPILLIHSRADDTSPIIESFNYRDTCKKVSRLCELIEFQTADHDFSDYNDRGKLLSHTLDFFQRQLAPIIK